MSLLGYVMQHMLSNLRFGGTVDLESVSPTAISTIRTWINATLTNVCFADNAGEPAASGCLSLPLHNVTTLIKGYPSSANEFLFDRRLNDCLWPLVKEYGRQKSVVILCTSRNSAMEAALALVDNVVAAAQELKTPQKGNVGQNEFSWHPGSMYWTNRPSVLVRDQSHWETLQRAALKMENLELKRLVPHGIGFLHAGMSLGDKCLMKALFESGDLRILCCTAPPSLTHAESARQLLIILKGTKRYVNSYKATETAGYSEADGYAVINIIREAAVKLFGKSLPALAIIMTEQKVRAFA